MQVRSRLKGIVTSAAIVLLAVPAPCFADAPAKLLPPIAPSLDLSAFEPVQPTSQNLGTSPSLNPSYDSGYEPEQAEDRTKSMLRQALEKHSQGNKVEAQRLFRQVLTIDSRNVDANYNLGAIAEEDGDLSGAARYYQTAASNGHDQDIQDALASVNEKIRTQKAAQHVAEQTKRTDRLRQVAQNAATAYKAGNYDQAIRDLEQIASESPNDPNVQFGLGQAYRGKGDNARAKQHLSKAVALAPENQLYANSLSELNSQAKQIANEPAAAADYSNRGFDSQAPSYGRNDQLASEDLTPAGQIQPFSDQGAAPLYGHAFNDGGSNGGMSLGGLGSMLGGGSMSGGRGSRMVRNAVMGSLGGAAMGALTNMHGAGGVKGGAMKGAIFGGVMGLITGF